MYRNITQFENERILHSWIKIVQLTIILAIKHFSFIDYIYIAYKFWDNFNISKF